MSVDKDGIWKDAVSNFLPQLLKRMIPELYDDVDFSQKPTFLDKELQDTIQVSLSEEHKAAKLVDTLVQLPLKSGKNQWILLHVEVQGKGGEDISLRMILYCCLIFAHYHRMPVALAILTDKRPSDETLGKFEFNEYGTKLIYKYNLFEVYDQNDDQLLNSDNPFDSFIYAAKKYSNYMSKNDQKIKLEYLLKITRNLYQQGLNEQDRAKVIVLVSRLINLEDIMLRKEFFNELKKLEGKTDMAEMNWIQEYFYDEARDRVRDEGIAIGKERTLNAAIDFMRSNGMSNEQISNFRNSMLKN